MWDFQYECKLCMAALRTVSWGELLEKNKISEWEMSIAQIHLEKWNKMKPKNV